jgi:hypothetical protein
MTWTAGARTVMLAALFGFAAAAAAEPLTAATLQRLLRDAPEGEVRFTEQRESPWLAAPVQSSGTMKSGPQMLEKHVEQPRRETWRILKDRMQLVAAGAESPKEILFADVPAMAALANALRSAMAGDLPALQNDFRLALTGDAHRWTLRLVPRAAAVAQHVKHLELQGSGGRLQLIEILESQGERTTTHLIHDH